MPTLHYFFWMKQMLNSLHRNITERVWALGYNITMGCWELSLNLSLHAHGFSSHGYIPRVHIMIAHCLIKLRLSLKAPQEGQGWTPTFLSWVTTNITQEENAINFIIVCSFFYRNKLVDAILSIRGFESV